MNTLMSSVLIGCFTVSHPDGLTEATCQLLLLLMFVILSHQQHKVNKSCYLLWNFQMICFNQWNHTAWLTDYCWVCDANKGRSVLQSQSVSVKCWVKLLDIVQGLRNCLEWYVFISLCVHNFAFKLSRILLKLWTLKLASNLPAYGAAVTFWNV